VWPPAAWVCQLAFLSQTAFSSPSFSKFFSLSVPVLFPYSCLANFFFLLLFLLSLSSNSFWFNSVSFEFFQRFVHRRSFLLVGFRFFPPLPKTNFPLAPAAALRKHRFQVPFFLHLSSLHSFRGEFFYPHHAFPYSSWSPMRFPPLFFRRVPSFIFCLESL